MLVRAYAKINLNLAVGPALTDGAQRGYHPICSWFACIDLWDDVEIVPAPVTTLERAWAPDALRPSPIDWPQEKDTAWKARDIFERELGRPCPMHIRITKRIPVGGGLGGGSSNGAAVLRAMRAMLAPEWSDERMQAMGARIGSDVAYFCDRGLGPARQAIVSGLGECIERVKGVRGTIGLVTPPFGCETRLVYGAFDEMGLGGGFEERAGAVRSTYDLAVRDGLERLELINDLAAPAERVSPDLRAWRERLARETGGRAYVTGSGSSLFVINPPPHAKLDSCKLLWGP
jgi:4-diphosphocytidyl-2-C-methyl-D-erythritol kinase